MTTIESISFDLGAGERLLWSGAPKQGVVWRATDVVMVPFSLMWGGFALFWEITALRHAPLFFALWGVPFVVIGLYITVGRFFYDAWRRSHTYYGLTNQRAIVATRTPAPALRSYALASLTNVVLQERGNGSGSILLGPGGAPTPWMRQTGMLSTHVENSFEMIPDAKRVFDMIGDAQKDDAAAIRSPG